MLHFGLVLAGVGRVLVGIKVCAQPFLYVSGRLGRYCCSHDGYNYEENNSEHRRVLCQGLNVVDDFFGSGNQALTPTMQMLSIQDQGVREAVKNSNTFRFMARVNNFSKPSDLANERKRFSRENLQGEDGGILLFPNTYSDIRQIEQKAYTVDKSEREEIRTSVYNYFGVNEDVLQNKAYGDKWQAFYEGAIEPFAIQFSEALTRAMFTFNEQGNGNEVMLTANRLQYMSTQEKLNVSSQLSDRGILNRDDVREIWNLPPLPEPYGSQLPIRGEYYNVNEVTNDGTDEDD